MEPTPDRTLMVVAIFAGAAVMLFAMVAAGAEPAALPGVAAVIAAIGLAAKRTRG